MPKSFFLLLVVWTVLLTPLFGQVSTPNDPLFPRQWHLINKGQSGGNSGSDIGIQEAWKITTGGTTLNGDTIVICLIDNGISTKHPDLVGNIWKNHKEIPDNQKDDDHNGYLDDYMGWNVYQDTHLIAGGKHGTPLAGIMAAKGNNAVGITGLNWDVKIMTVVGGFLDEKTVVKAYRYPWMMRNLYNDHNGEQGAFVVVVNASWGRRNLKAADYPDWCSSYNTLGDVGILSVAAVTNDRLDIDKMGDMPASCKNPFLLTVTNSDHYDSRVPHAGYGKYSVDLAAPGKNVFSLKGSQGYDLTGGASASAPQVSGAIALLYSAPLPGLMKLQAENPAMAALQVKDWIMRGVDKLPQFEGVTVSGGRLNVGRSIELAMQEDSCLSCPAPLGVQVEKRDTNSYFFTCYSHGADAIQMTVNDGQEVVKMKFFAKNKSGITITLAPDVEYEIHFQAFCGEGRSSRVSTFRMNTSNVK